MRCVLIVHPDAARRREIRESLGDVEVLEAATREEALPQLKGRGPGVVVAHHAAFRSLLRDLERYAPAATRVALSSPHQDVLGGLEEVSAQGFDFETVDEGALDRLRRVVNPKRSLQYQPGPVLTARFSLLGLAIDSLVEEIGSDGLSLMLPFGQPAASLVPGMNLEHATVSSEATQLLEPRTWTIRSTRLVESKGLRVNVAFQTAPLERPPDAAMVIDDSLRLRGLILRAVARKAGFELQTQDGSARHRFHHAVLPRGSERLVVTRPDAQPPFRTGQVVRLSFELGGEQLVGLAIVLDSGPGGVTLRCPDQLQRRHRRSSLRASVGSGLEAFIDIRSPLGGTLARRRLLDLHPEGAAFSFSAAQEVFPPGLILDEVTIHVGGRALRTSATVQTTSPATPCEVSLPGDGPFRRCGLRLGALSSSDGQHLRDVVIRSVDPRIVDGSDMPFELVWAMFSQERAAYQDHPFEDPGTLSRLAGVQRQLGRGDHGLSKTFVYCLDGTPLGHASGLLTHSATWLSMHLLVRAGYHRAHRASQSLVTRVFDYAEALSQVMYVRGFWRLKNRWAARIYGALAARLFHPGLSYVASFTPMRRALGSPLPEPRVRATTADAREVAHLLSFARRSEDPVRLAADDLVEGEATLGTIGRRYRELGLSRARSIGVVRDSSGSNPLGFVVVEHMSPGVFWAEMYNSFRLYLLDPAGPGAHEARHALVAFAEDALRAGGRNVGECHASDLDVSSLALFGYESLGRMMEFGAHRSLVRAIDLQLMGIFDRLDAKSHHEREVLR